MEKVMENVFENVTDANKKAVDAVLNLNKIAVRTQGLLARQQLAVLENWLEAGNKHLQMATETRDPKEFMARQTEVAVEFGEKLVTVAQESLDIQAQARDELTAWVEDGLKAVKVPSVAKATKTVKKAVA